MKITRAQIYLCEIDGRRPLILRLWTDDGTQGLGEAALAYGIGATGAVAVIEEMLRRIVLGRNAHDVEPIWSDLYDHTFWAKGGGPIIYAAISAIETALWDIKGRALGVPVYQLLGGAYRHDVRCYANGWSFRAVTPEETARATEMPLKAGYDALKFYPLATPIRNHPNGIFAHVSRREFDRDFEDLAVARVKAVRDAVGPKVELMVDMSAELTTDAILRLGRRLEEFDLTFFEEPVDPFDPEGIKSVADGLRIPIAAGERLYTRYGFRRLFELRAVAIVQPDIGIVGGMMETKKIAAIAEMYNMRVQPHLCAGPVATAAALQLDACIPNFLIQELYPFRVPEHFDLVDAPLEPQVRNGRVAIPQRPGLGVDLVEDRVAPFLRADISLGDL
ncbi:mandelate racemase/muconate lactonizing enzyme family protein [Roseomonas sp. JC162]|uniref:Mandelate racemase/muconate lactonizing enzyme family protein n=1 Tax=Neoroseomonas marina TaxID=1232220 RepID=A0A848E986_9PROT|nr:mandelate racemase/muconate lactonizing enzyme family protein [Neoroseomonas marina]NMJ40722.1 mandelate racemase/muconate lactonizing enzyme family protein [Neoroseomonas marina]